MSFGRPIHTIVLLEYIAGPPFNMALHAQTTAVSDWKADIARGFGDLSTTLFFYKALLCHKYLSIRWNGLFNCILCTVKPIGSTIITKIKTERSKSSG